MSLFNGMFELVIFLEYWRLLTPSQAKICQNELNPNRK